MKKSPFTKAYIKVNRRNIVVAMGLMFYQLAPAPEMEDMHRLFDCLANKDVDGLEELLEQYEIDWPKELPMFMQQLELS